MTFTSSFDIRAFLSVLTPTTQKNRFICPVCGKNDLTVNPNDGAYSCWSGGCAPHEIREAISPRNLMEFRPRSYQERNKKAVTDSIAIEIHVDQLFREVLNGIYTPRQALVAMTTWAKEHGHDRWECKELLKEKLEALPDKKTVARNRKACKLITLQQEIEGMLAGGIRLNLLTNRLEWQGEYLPGKYFRLFIARECNLDISEQDAFAILGDLGERNAYHPIQDWLEELEKVHGTSTVDLLNEPSKLLLGTSKPIYDLYLRNQMIAAVARIYEPGCKVDFATLLQGKQSSGKSTFWRILAGSEWFDDSVTSDLENKDELAKLNECWFEELQEFDRITNKKEAAIVKSFVSRQIDRYRAAYERTVEKHPRRMVLVGTVNPSEFLVDETGNRRFQVIPVTVDKVDLEQLKRLRNQLWAAALALYKQGVPWHLSHEQEKEAAIENQAFEVQDLWNLAVTEYLANTSNLLEKEEQRYALPSKILESIGVPLGQQDQRHKNRLSKILTRLGWSPTPGVIRLPGFSTPVRAWYCSVTVGESNSTVTTTVTEDRYTQNPHSIKSLDICNGSNGCIDVIEKGCVTADVPDDSDISISFTGNDRYTVTNRSNPDTASVTVGNGSSKPAVTTVTKKAETTKSRKKRKQKIQVGDRIRYSGDRYPTLKGREFIAASVSTYQAMLQNPDGSYETWIDFNDLETVE